MPALTARAGAHVVVLDGRTATVDGLAVLLAPQQAALLEALLRAPGRVRSRSDLLAVAWPEGEADEHAVEMAVTRLRAALGPAGRVVQTVVKRGYRLAPATG